MRGAGRPRESSRAPTVELRVTELRKVPLNVLDLASREAGASNADAVAGSIRLAQAAESLGYERFWVAEHHGMPAVASSAPAVLIAGVAARTERAHDVLRADQAAEPLGFEARAIGPVGQGGVEGTLFEFEGDQRGRAVGDLALLLEVDPGRVTGLGLQEQPVLVERSARHAELLAGEVLQALDRAVLRHHHGALGGRIGDEAQALALVAEPRCPEQVADDRIDLTADEADPCGVVAGELRRLQGKAVGGVEAARLDDRRLPGGGAEGQASELDRRKIARMPGAGREAAEQASGEHGTP